MYAFTIHLVDMINIVFSQPPSKWRNTRIWRVHTGHHLLPFRTFATKREACEFTALMGRECTQALRELNECFRRACNEGQGYALTMTNPQLVAWNELKCSFDLSLAFIAIRTSIIPPNAFTRLVGMAKDIAEMSKLIGSMIKVRYTGTQTSMLSVGREAMAILERIERLWSGIQVESQIELTEDRRMQG